MNIDPLIGLVPPPALHVMTFNILRRDRRLIQPRVGRWVRHREAIAALLAAERPALLGVQEAMPELAQAVRDALGPGYRCWGGGRGCRSHGEGSPLFFDDERLELLNWDQKALSDQPDVAGSTSWGN